MTMDFTDNLLEPDKEKDEQNLFTDEQSGIEQDKSNKKSDSLKSDVKWKVLVVDDEKDVHSVTRMALNGFAYMDREIEFLHAYSAQESMKVLQEHNDIALIYLDVVMESNHAGLELVKYIRNEMKNNLTQIILRTGYPGQAPEREVITEYEINDYKTKTELTSFRLFTITLASLRAYNSMMHLDNLRQTLEEKVKDRTAELEKQNQHIKEMDQMKTRFFANISHEFRTPLSLITSPVEEMLLQDDLSDKERNDLELIYSNAIRLLGLVNQLLDLSKIDAGNLKIELIKYDLFKVLHSIIRGFTPFSERKKINFNITIPKGSYITLFDYDKLYKIITNLLNNAFKFTPEKGEISIHITLSEEGEHGQSAWLEIKVSDSGQGIATQDLKKIFDRFYQATDHHGAGGTGIGLSLVNELLCLQHGTISLQSEINKGTDFTVKLPLGKEHLKPTEYTIIPDDKIPDIVFLSKTGMKENRARYSSEEDISMENEKPVVLLVEDNHDILEHITEYFSPEFTIKQATDGNKGWEQADAYIPDLIISDLMMPGLTGIELCEKIKNSENTCHIPVILLTAQADTTNKVEGFETGADDYITKPFNIGELISRAKNLIDQRKKLQDIYHGKLDIEPAKINVKSADDKFLKKAMEVIQTNMGDSDFDVNSFYPEMNMSRMQLFRKIKSLLNQTPSDLIRTMRLKKASQLMKQNFGNVAEIAFEVGFNNLSYFAKCFKEQYGVLPSEYGVGKRNPSGK